MFNKRKQKSGQTGGGRQEPRVTEGVSPTGGTASTGYEEHGHGGPGAAAPAQSGAGHSGAGHSSASHGSTGHGGTGQAGAGSQAASAGPARQPTPRPDASAVLNRQPTPPVRPDASRRSAASGRGQSQGADLGEGRKLLVGREISLSGEIRSCETLVVEGTVEAEINGTRLLDVQPNGLFKGTATVDVAEIAGRFDGDLTVRERLYVRASGHVHGTIRYRGLEIESGGRIGGTLTELTDEPGEAGAGQPGGERPGSTAGPSGAAGGGLAANGRGEPDEHGAHGRLNGQGGHGEAYGASDRPASGSGR
jgi:cytoskeletal protein CcmA (bactofilin family)